MTVLIFKKISGHSNIQCITLTFTKYFRKKFTEKNFQEIVSIPYYI